MDGALRVACRAAELFLEFLTTAPLRMAVLWWLSLVMLGFAFLPLTLAVFKGFHDGGYLFSRLLGLLLSSYTVWLLSSLGVAPFSEGVVFAVAGSAALIHYAVPGSFAGVRAFFREKRKVVLAEEYLFLFAFLAWTLLRSFKPDIEGIEKFMDFGLVNAVLRAEWMPPADMWFSGAPVNYYYFGHFVAAFLVRLTGTPPEIAYNLMIAALFAFSFALSFSIVFNMLLRTNLRSVKKAVAGGLLAALLLTLGANLHPFVYGTLLPALKSAGLYEGEVERYWYPGARSFIGSDSPPEDKPIHEFPAYAFVLADLHGHVLDTPTSLASLGIGVSMLLSPPGTAGIRAPAVEALSGVLLGTTWMTNTWNYPIYLLVLCGAAFVRALKRHGLRFRALAETLLAAAALLAVSQAAALPFNLHFENMTKGVYRVMANSPLWQLGIVWGHQTFFAVCFGLFLLRRIRANARRTRLLGIPEAALVPSDVAALAMFTAAFCLVAIPEIVYVKDIYIQKYHRANTMFKMAYQAALLFALASGYAAARVAGSSSFGPKRRAAVVLLFAAVAAMPLTYPYWSIPGFYGPLPEPGRYRGLDGLAFLPAADAEIVEWFRRNVEGNPVILEADGESYTRYGRISMATGLPTLLGWHAHEWIWRGSPDGPDERRDDVRTLYESDDGEAVRRLVERYGIRYIVVGALERERFPSLKERRLEAMGRVVLRTADGSKIVELAPFRKGREEGRP